MPSNSAHRSYLLINPLSGSYSPALRDVILSQLHAAGLTPESLEVTGPEDARRVCTEIESISPNPLLIIAGGDGTVNAVVNALTPGCATLAVLPAGTANVLALELGISGIADGIARIARGGSRPLAVGVVEREGVADQRFVLMAGIGLDGEVVQGVRVGEKRMLKKGAYLLSALRCLLTWRQGLFPLTADGRTLECHSAIVCNGARYGGSTLLTPGADISEPQLELFCITAGSRWAYLRIILSVMAGRPCRAGDVTLLRAGGIVVGGDREIQVDGDHVGRAPAQICVVADFARIVV